MNNYVDYVFYRIAKLYYKYDGANGLHASALVSLTEAVIAMDILLILSRQLFSRDTLEKSNTLEFLICAISFFPFLIFNYFRYIRFKAKYPELDGKWKNETGIAKTLKGYAVLLALLVPWILLYFDNWVFNR